ncbi:Flp family type IVb pilin [Pelodictyon phaeoclathratiforme]|nr:Flp family type IVb pilin [Pelodictyon phaeoclathratiforme]MBV5289890.1 Flp family type IVb pilin [Pelodictyon phaeoclathratiforme]
MIDYLVAAVVGLFGGNLSIRSQKGVTMIEYALIAGLISVATIAAVTLIGTSLNEVFEKISDALDGI